MAPMPIRIGVLLRDLPSVVEAVARLNGGFIAREGLNAAVGAAAKHGARNLPARCLQKPGRRGFQTHANRNESEFLHNLNKRGDPESVIGHFESGRIAPTEEAVSEYVKALATLDRLDKSALLKTLQAGLSTRMHHLAENRSPTLGAAAAVTGGGSEGLGSPKNPVNVTQAEPSLRNQMWRTIRTLGLGFIVLSGIGALMEDKGVPGRFLTNSEVRPILESDTKFDDVKGVDEAKQELVEIVEYLKGPERFTRLGGKLPKGVLLVGPPGTGKTMLARAIAGEAGVPFFYSSGSEFEEMFVGVGARRIRDLFKAAKAHSPCIIFIDEIDAVGGKRSPKDQQYMKMTLNQLLVEMDGFKQNQGVIVVGATNFPESLDKALVRPGRFDRQVVVPNPDVEGRRQILESHFKNIPRAADVDLSIIARGSPGFSGADLANLVNTAALKAAVDQAKAVTMAALEYAKDRIMMGAERKSAVISEESRRLTAYHEGGHALVALFTDGANPVHKATIVPRGAALGMVTQLPEKDETSISRKQLLARLDVAMGGRVAEELIFGEEEVTTGASSDLQHATRLARAMVTKYGMSKRVGNISHDYDGENGLVISSETKQVIEDETRELVDSAYIRAKALVKRHEKDLHKLAKQLLERETLTGDQIRLLLNKGRAISVDKAPPNAAVSSV